MTPSTLSEKKPIEGGHCKLLSLSQISVSEFNARDQEIEPITSQKFIELCDSIRNEGGLIEPLVVRPVNGKYEIIAGTRRFRALKHLGVQDTTVIVRDMDDNDLRIASLVENVHRTDLLETEKQKTLEDIYLAAWPKWRPDNWEHIIPRDRDKRSGKVKFYDQWTDEAKLALTRAYLSRLKKADYRDISRNTVSLKSHGPGRPQAERPPLEFIALRERIGYVAGTQYEMLLGHGSGISASTAADYIEELPPMSRKQFDEDQRVKEATEEEKKALAKKLKQEAAKLKKYKSKSKKQIAKETTDKFFKDEEKKKQKAKQKQQQRQKALDEDEEDEEKGSKSDSTAKRQPAPTVLKTPQLEPNPHRAREAITDYCSKLYKLLVGVDLDLADIKAASAAARTHDAKARMKEIATFYVSKEQLALLQYAVIPVNEALSLFRDAIYESIESEKRKDDLLRP